MNGTSVRTFESVFEALFTEADGLMECRALPGKDRIFLKPGDNVSLQRFIDQHPNDNIFFGVATRKDSTSGRLQNCALIRAVFVDLDFKTFASAREARERLNEFPLRPSIVVNSGGGLHAYWLLRQAVDLQKDSSEFRNILRRTARSLHADMAAAEPARVLRVPGTLNLKPEYDPPVLVTVQEHAENRYSLDDFEFLPPEPEPDKPRMMKPTRTTADRQTIIERAEKYLAAIPPAIEGQGGDPHTYRACCKLVRDFGLAEAEAFDLLIGWNARCQPPWSERELQEKIRNAVRYGDQPIGWRLDRDIPRNGNGDGPIDTISGGNHVLGSPSRPTEFIAETAEPLILDPADPVPTARRFVERFHIVGEHRALQHQAGLFYQYNGRTNSYSDVEEAAIRAKLYAYLESAKCWSQPKGKGKEQDLIPFRPTKSKVENALDALRAVCNLPASKNAPCWLDTELVNPFDVMACTNGLLHIPSRRLLPSTPEFFTLNGISFAFDPDAEAPHNWLRFLAELWPDDAQSIDTLQEWLGYLLTPRTHLQKMLMLVGPKRSGKGTIGRVNRLLLGERNVCGPMLANMAEPFGLSTLIGKSVAIIADARISGRTDTAVITERLLSISGEDTLSVPRKHLPDWNGKLPTRFMLMTNELPRIEDTSGALASRFLVLTLNQSFYGREDHALLDRFIPELPGILLWALDGWARLEARGRFLQPASAAEMIQQFEDLGSPISAFLRDCCEIDRGFEVSAESVFAAWKTWCEENGREHPGTVQAFGRNLRAVVPWLKVTQPRVLGRQVRYYEGLRLQEGEAR